MYAEVTTKANSNLSSLKTKLCMDCGHIMIAVDSCVENNTHYIWYKCTKCNGQWLNKEIIPGPQGSDYFAVPTKL